MLRLGALLYPEFEMFDLYGPLEMFGSVGADVEIITIAQAAGPIRPTKGPATIAEYDFDSAPPFDLLLVPGGIGTIPQLENGALMKFLHARAATARITMSVCSGSAILAKAGLLDGRRATSNKMFFNLAVAQSVKVRWVESARWVQDGPFVTSSGVSAGTDMALAVIADVFGLERAEQVARYTEYQWHRDAAVDPFVAYLNRASVPSA